MVQQALLGQQQDDRPLHWATEKFVSDLTNDADQVIVTSSEAAPIPQISQRGVRMSLLGMAMAIDLGWDENNVREVRLCALLHDWGMLRLSEELQDPRNPIESSKWAEVTMHPLYTLELLETMKKTSIAIRLAVTQVHENPDGSGYPRGLEKDEIHPYARILHVADAYITLTAEMCGRQAFISYDVMVYLLNQVKAQRMDDGTTRALLNVVSLFPIGSHVRLSDGSEA